MSELSPLSSDQLLVATPERVTLSLPLAGIGSRTLAYLLDLGLMLLFWSAAYFIVALLSTSVYDVVTSMRGVAIALGVLGLFATQWLYWTVAEVFWMGQSVGKRVAGIRVVREDGAPVGFIDSAVRNLSRAVDFLPVGYGVGAVVMLCTARQQRLGDLLAGTVLVRDVKVSLAKYDVEPGAPATARMRGALRPEDAELILAFLARAPGFDAEAATRLRRKLATRFLGEGEVEASALAPEDVDRRLRERAVGNA